MQSECKKTDSKFLSAYSKKRKVSLSFTGEGRTKQAFKAECDINNILARYQRTGVLEFQQRMEPRYGDVTAHDFQKAQFIIAEARGMFMAMPAALRDRFENDPGKFLAFVQNERNREEAEQLGLLKVKPEPEEGPQGPSSKAQANPPARGGGGTPPKAEKSPQGSKTPSPTKSGEGSGEG